MDSYAFESLPRYFEVIHSNTPSDFCQLKSHDSIYTAVQKFEGKSSQIRFIHFLKKVTFIQQGCIILIISESKDIYIVTKACLNVRLNFIFIKGF